MRSSYRRIGDFIQQVKVKNTDGVYNELLGINIDKFFMPSVANIVGTDLTRYKVVKSGQFACNRMHVGRDYRIPIALSKSTIPFIVSPAYTVFEIVDSEELYPEYLMMWFSRSEFDRNAWFHTDADVRGGLPWDLFCDLELPIPSIEKQRAIVKEYNTVVNRIKLNEQLNTKLEETAQALYKHWFVDFEFPSEALAKDGVPQPYKRSGGKMVFNAELDKEIPEGWEVDKLAKKCSKIGSGSTPRGGKENYKESGISLIRSMNVHDFNFVDKDLAFIDSKQADKLKNVEVIENDILLNITGASVARCCIVPKRILPARVNQHVSIIRLKVQCEHYLLCALCSTDYKRKLLGVSESGSTREAITKDDIENLEMLFPSSNKLLMFENTIKPLFEHRSSLSKERESLKKIKYLLLSKMTRVEVEKEVEV